jgi:hypothetical protein
MGTYEEYAAIWQQLLQMNGGDPALAMMMMDRLDDMRGGGEPDVIQPPMPRPSPVVQPPMPRPTPMPRPSPVPGRLVGAERIPSAPPGGGGGNLPGLLDPPSLVNANYAATDTLGGADMRRRFDTGLLRQLDRQPPVGRLSDEYAPPVSPSPAPRLIPPPGRLVGEDQLPPPTTPAAAAPLPPTVSSAGGGGGEMVGPPMPRPNQQTMDGGIWAALRAAFANNAGNNERLALERMVASLGGGDRG